MTPPAAAAWMNPGVQAAVMALMLVVIGVRTYRSIRRLKAAGQPLRPMPPDGSRFAEQGASGHSEKSLRTRWSGASRCLLVWVSATELSVQTMFPFNVMVGDADSDLEHRVPLSRVTTIERDGKTAVRVGFTDDSGTAHTLRLQLKDPERFVAALRPDPLA